MRTIKDKREAMLWLRDNPHYEGWVHRDGMALKGPNGSIVLSREALGGAHDEKLYEANANATHDKATCRMYVLTEAGHAYLANAERH